MRITEPGWVLCAMNDPAGRRGIWYRETRDLALRVIRLEICSGREGDDDYVCLDEHERLTDRKLYELVTALLTGAWMVEEDPVAAERLADEAGGD